MCASHKAEAIFVNSTKACYLAAEKQDASLVKICNFVAVLMSLQGGIPFSLAFSVPWSGSLLTL